MTPFDWEYNIKKSQDILSNLVGETLEKFFNQKSMVTLCYNVNFLELTYKKSKFVIQFESKAVLKT